MTTKVIVQAGRCVFHEGKRRFEGAKLDVCDEDLEAWTKSGDVGLPTGTQPDGDVSTVANVADVISATPEQTYDAITAMAKGLQEAGLVNAEDTGTGDGQSSSSQGEAGGGEEAAAEQVADPPAQKSKTKAGKA